jgi:hypothetical protein
MQQTQTYFEPKDLLGKLSEQRAFYQSKLESCKPEDVANLQGRAQGMGEAMTLVSNHLKTLFGEDLA